MKRREHQHIQFIYRAAQSGREALRLALGQVLGGQRVEEANLQAESAQRRSRQDMPEAMNDSLLPRVQGGWVQHSERLQVMLDEASLVVSFPSARAASQCAAMPEFQRLLPHICQAYALAKQVERKQQYFWWSQTLVAQLPMPVWIFDTNMTAVVENRAASTWARKYQATQCGERGGWQHFCQLVTSAWSASLRGENPAQRVTQALELNGRVSWLELRRLPRGGRIDAQTAPLLRTIQGELCFVRMLEWHASPAQLEGVQQRWHLTPSEREILGSLLQGQCIKHIARQRHTAEVTVRKQVKALMRKVNVSSQEQLLVQLCDALAVSWNEEGQR